MPTLRSLALLSVLAVCQPFALGQSAMKLEDIVSPGTESKVLGTGYGFTEGPAADARGNVYFSDGQHNSIHFYEIGKPVVLFVDDSTDANGMIFNHKGELLVCEGAAYRVVAFDVQSKQKRVLASEIDGTHFNEPNDLDRGRGRWVLLHGPQLWAPGPAERHEGGCLLLQPAGER